MNITKYLEYLEIKSCCYCSISLKTGTKLFGWLSLVGALVLCMTTSVIIITNMDFYMPYIFFATLDVITQLTQATTAFILLLGVYQAKRNLVVPWLISSIIYAFVELLVLSSTISRFLNEETILFSNHELSTFYLFMIVDDVYGWLVVFSYYKSLSDHGNERVTHSQLQHQENYELASSTA